MVKIPIAFYRQGQKKNEKKMITCVKKNQKKKILTVTKNGHRTNSQHKWSWAACTTSMRTDILNIRRKKIPRDASNKQRIFSEQ